MEIEMAANLDHRHDRETANTVRSGLIVLGLYGPAVAARWLRMRGVPLAVARQVITKPWLRRSDDYVIAGGKL